MCPERCPRFIKGSCWKNIQRYVEPFVGSGAVLFYILQNYHVKIEILAIQPSSAVISVSFTCRNHGKETFVIKRGERIAQMVVQKVVRADIVVAEELDETARSSGGFGHTGVK